MRKLMLGLMALIVSLNLFSVPNSTGAVSDGFRVVNENDKEVVVEFLLPEYKIDKLIIDKETFNVISSTTQAYTTEVGMPYLPIFGTGISVPNQGKVSYEVIDSEYTEIKLDNIFPSQKEGFVYENISLEESDYTGYFPNAELTSGDSFILRDLRVKPVQVKPFHYNKREKSLRVYEKITFKISTDTEKVGFNELNSSGKISASFQSLYQANVLNYHRDVDTIASPNILFIYRENSDPVFNFKLNQYVQIKKQKGFNVLSVSTGDIGSTSSTGIKNYIQTLYDGSEFKPDYVVLVGDVNGSYGIPTFNEYYADNAEGDYPYTHLAGNDLVGDIFIGRMSINNSTDLSRYVGKMRSYERLLNPVDEEYLNHMLLVGDTSPSGESTVNHCKFVKQISSKVNPDYSYTEIYGDNPNVSTMNQTINNGVDFFIYRGYINMSGWSPGSSQTNTHKLNHGVMITCATGNFASTATTESYVNQGTETSPRGGITAIGMATASTHTSFNNSLSGGIFHGIYNMGQRTMGEALLSGKVTTYIVYSDSDMSDVKQFTHWCNLIGDPTVDVYTGQPNSFLVETSDFYSDSEELLTIIRDQNNLPVSSASVTLTTQSGEIIKTFTNNEGIANLPLEIGETEYTLTANKKDFFPFQIDINPTDETEFRISSLIIDDDNEGQSNGNNNQNIEAGETIELNFMLNSLVDYDQENIQAQLTVNNFQIDVVQATSEITSLPANGSSLFDTNFILNANNNIIDDTEIAFVLDLTYGDNQTKRLYYSAQVHNGNLLLTDINIIMLGNNLQSDQVATIQATVQNQANTTIENATARLVIDNGHFNVETENILIPVLASNQSQTLDFQISSDIDMFPGMITECILKFTNEINFYQELEFEAKFGNTDNTSPLGPDMFGYVIYDSNDIDYPECPVYDWIDIAPNNGGSGIELDIYDPSASGEGDGVGSNSTDTINLPFQFIYYGESYNQITVCSNGFISFGENSIGEFRNWRLPGALGPNGMIAAFWDDLQMDGNSGVYSYYDSVEDYFVIQWEQMINGAENHNDEETFQIILYNPQRYPSSLNQGTVKIQYKVFNNVDNGNPGNYTPWHGNYATIGIESPYGNDGLEYTYNQNYPAGAHQLEDGMALFITTKPVLLVEPNINIADLIVIDENNNEIYEIGEEIMIGVSLTNLALTPLTNTSATINCTDPRVTILNNFTTFDDLTINQSVFSRDYFIIELNEELNNDEIISLNMQIDGDNGYHFFKDINLKVNKPTISSLSFIINDYSELGNNNFIPEQGENIYLAWEIENTSPVEGFFDTVSISSANDNLNLSTTSLNNVKVKAHSVQQLVFEGSISPEAPNFGTIEVVLTAEKSGRVILEDSFIITLNTSETSIDFEDDDIPITLSSPWQIGSSNSVSANSGSNIMATNLNSNYPDNSNSIAWTDYINGTPTSNLTFWHRYAFENNYDGGQIIINVEGSSSSEVLTPETNYSHSNVSALGGPGYSSSLNQWTQVVVNLPEQYQGQSIRFGFRFASDYMVNNSGWFIDDVVIGGSIQESFVFNGTVALEGGNEDASAVDISLGHYSINPNSNGEYQSLLPLGTYDVTFSLPGYRTEIASLSDINSNLMISEDVTLNYLNIPENLDHTLQDSLVTLTWNYEEDLDDELSFFIIEMKFNTGEWEELAQVTDNEYSLLLNRLGTYSFRIRANYDDDYSSYSNTILFDYNTITNNEFNDATLVTKLHSNYPNPFNPVTNIAYTLAKPSKVNLKVYNLKGQLVKTLVNEKQTTGNHKVVWNGKNNQNRAVASGIYFIRIDTDNYSKTHKAILMK